MTLEEDARALLDAGFTRDEIATIVGHLQFAVVIGEGMGDRTVKVQITDGVEWTPEKRAAYTAYLSKFLTNIRKPDADA